MVMDKNLNLVKDFHKKFEVPILKKPSLVSKDRYEFRYALMKEEVE